MKKLLFIMAAWLVLCPAGHVFADTNDIPHICRVAPKKIPVPVSHDAWDSTRVYRQMVLLIEYADTTFSMPDPHAYYDSLLNRPGFNKGAGPGCAAEYMQEQSKGLFHVHFDIFGPLAINLKAQRSAGYNGGVQEKYQALDSLFAAYPNMDYSIYDWNGDNVIEQVVYVCAGTSSNLGYSGFVWPNTTDAPYGKRTPDGLNIDQHSITCEDPYPAAPGGWLGFGTLVHEFSHTLGLPDVYPTGGKNASLYSVADTWDLMDGGNYINYGWCPPNYTAHELMYMNWLTPVELTSDTTITGMRPVADGGQAYLIRHTENEYLLLENRQQTGWDYGIPGHGLTIWHIDFDTANWQSNEVNNDNLGISMYFADNMNYMEWLDYYQANKSLFGRSRYALAPLMRSWLLSSAAYPYRMESTGWLNDNLTDDSTPALGMYHPNAQGSTSLGKCITDIQEAPDGSISFTLKGTDDTAGLDHTRSSSLRGDDRGRLILRDGQLLILHGDKTYTVTGTIVK